MKFILLMSLLMLPIAHSIGAEAAKPMKKAETSKIAYATKSKIFTDSPELLPHASEEWRLGLDRVQEMLKPADVELKKLADEFEKGKKEFEDLRKTGIASEDALRKKMQTVGELEYKLYQSNQQRQQFIQGELYRLAKELEPKLNKATEAIAKEQGWDVVLFLGEAVGYAKSDKFDVTADILAVMNKDYKAEKAKKEADEKAKAKK